MPSPFPPIADFGFLSDCHTGALVAPDGGVDWLCVPRFDAPSVFGSLLDREAGTFRFGPYGINVPTQRIYEAGTNVLVTTWKTPSGWVVVRDALTMGPTRGPDIVTPHTRPPADDDAEHVLVRTAECVDGQVEMELVCEPVFDYGAIPATWALVDGSSHTADATGGGGRAAAAHRHVRRHRRWTGPGPPHAAGRRPDLLLAVVGRGPRRTGRRRMTLPDASTRPCGSGGTGSTRRGSPTIAGATRSSARR